MSGETDLMLRYGDSELEGAWSKGATGGGEGVGKKHLSELPYEGSWCSDRATIPENSSLYFYKVPSGSNDLLF